MKLTKVRITDFQSIQDSNEVDIEDITCLVGKNESGKTAFLKALYHLNPINESDGNFDVTDDYPRGAMADYEDDVRSGRREPAEVVQATFELDSETIESIEATFGSNCLEDEKPTLTLFKGYSNELKFDNLMVNENATLRHLIETTDLPTNIKSEFINLKDSKEISDELSKREETELTSRLQSMLQKISEHGFSKTIYDQIIKDRIPTFLYFDEYFQMAGQDNLNALQNRVANGNLEDPDRPLLGLIALANLDVEQLLNPGRTETLVGRLEAAGSTLTQRVLKYWSQNKHIRMKFDIRAAQPGDPPGMQSGTNIWGRVEDTRHSVSTPIRTRSRGFVWFFSFLAWYFKLREEGRKQILLLDEPGLSLHGKAQEDLLRYFEEELKPHHQLIYTTHSPFMVDPTRFERARIVQDLSIDSTTAQLPDNQQGTKVIIEVLDATSDSLFPLQGALGYEIYQTLFIGPNSLVVEGVTDLLYIQTISTLLQEAGEDGLSPDWTITPVGGADKVPTFVALIGAQKHTNVAVLIDYQKKDQQSIQNLYKRKLLQQENVLTYANFATGEEADIEDMFNPKLYLKLVNHVFDMNLTLNDLPKGHPRIIKRIESHLEDNPPPNGAKFSHQRPARYFSENIGTLQNDLTEIELDRFRKAFERLNALLE